MGSISMPSEGQLPLAGRRLPPRPPTQGHYPLGFGGDGGTGKVMTLVSIQKQTCYIFGGEEGALFVFM